MESITFTPRMDPRFARILSSTPTWMAGQAKFVAVYDRPFWQANGLSGDAFSRLGPLFEVHDASPASGRAGALFGFVGVPVEKRRGYDDAIINASIAQMAQLFGEEAEVPRGVLFRDWSSDRFTATASDGVGNLTHPSYGPTPPLDAPWRDRVFFASSETGRQYGGYLEGALEAADHVLGEVISASAVPKKAVGRWAFEASIAPRSVASPSSLSLRSATPDTLRPSTSARLRHAKPKGRSVVGPAGLEPATRPL
jgi:monoamine oxidase